MTRRWRIAAALVAVALVGAGVVSLLARRARRLEGLRRAERFFVPAAVFPVPSPVHARVGDRWTFTIRAMHGGPEGTGSLDVLEVSPARVGLRVTPIGGGEAALAAWAFEPRVRSEQVLRSWQETLTLGDRVVDCDVVEIIDASSGGLDNMTVWIAIDRATDLPTFPGVVRMERLEFRGRGMVEWEVESVGPIASEQ